MKPSSPISPQPSRRGGFALVFALSVVILVCAIIAGVLVTSGTERNAAGGFMASVVSRQLADMSVSVVQTQINHATTLGPRVAWASQPGMIRTFDNSGRLQNGYKLYSAPNMISSTVDIAADLPPATWKEDRAVWVDLNAPITANGLVHFPVLDPAALNPVGTIEGLSGKGLDFSAAVGPTSYQPAPMPLRWLYVLRDGTMVSPTGGASATVAGATVDNPIVGRVAFWADDESSKVNVNTAGGGTGADDTYWDVPRASTAREANFGLYQPALKEYQRYPGHPGTTLMSSVMPGLSLDEYMGLSPRYRFGGTEGATRKPNAAVEPKTERLYASLDEMIFKAPGSAPRDFGNLYQAGSGGMSAEKQARMILDSRRFLMTAHSRAPETNLFNLPRIASWPIHRTSAADYDQRTSAYDKLIAFCASSESGSGGTLPYFFQREKSGEKPLGDLGIPRNLELYSYLQALTAEALPGFGGSLFAKYGNDRDQILTQIFDYIRCTNLYDANLGDAAAPADVKQFTNKFVDSSGPFRAGHGFVTPARHPTNGTQGFGRFFTLSELGFLFICNAIADDPATVVDESNGSNTDTNVTLTPRHRFGSGADVPTLLIPGQRRIQAALLLELGGVQQGWTVIRPDMTIKIKGLQNLNITCNARTYNLGFANDLKTTFFQRTKWNYSYGSSSTGGVFEARTLMYEMRAPFENYGNNSGLPPYNFVSLPFTIEAAPGTGSMTFSGGRLTVEIYSGITDSADNLVQTIELDVPSGTSPVPDLVTDGTVAASSAPATTPKDWWSFSMYGIDGTNTGSIGAAPNLFRGRMNMASSNPGEKGKSYAGCLVRDKFDVLRTMVPATGDTRLYAAMEKVPDDVFMEHRQWSEGGTRIASNLSGNGRYGIPGFDFGARYAPDVDYNEGLAAPDMPANATQTPHVSRDFDNGVANNTDGPFINKPDEGNASNQSNMDGYYKRVTGDEYGGPAHFSPNRIMPSPVMFGSLPTGVKAGKAWQTLLFRPQKSHPQYRESHAGSASGGNIPDHTLLDFFWMPIVEPYAISDRFSTAGKINLNYQIMPFTYIERSTGLRAILESEKLLAIPNNEVADYKVFDPSDNPGADYRKEIDITETLRQFENVFDSGKIFVSASEICDIHMVPLGATLSNIEDFWDDHQLTGDNSREHIYATLYNKLTTKSNTYTVHFRAQSLKKRKGTAPGTWEEGKDVITGEYRGSTTIERFINPHAEIPDYAASISTISDQDTLDEFYRWRVVENRQFAP